MTKHGFFQRFAHGVAVAVGKPWGFTLALTIVLTWGASGPLFHFSDTWQLAINTGTTIVTFLMVFLIQHTQNHDSAAIHLKLDELIRAIKDARNDYVAIEDRDESVLDAMKHSGAGDRTAA